MALKLFNTLGREVQEFKPLKTDKTVGLYSCGPTVYNYAHIGNYRSYVFADILKRVLQYNNYSVNHVMNITDVDDKTIRDSQKENKTLKDFTDFYTTAFFEDLSSLNIQPANKHPKASEYIDEMVAMITDLIAKDFAYQTETGDVYFKIDKMPSYGALANLNLEAQKANASGRIKTDEYDKDNAQDFALWKAWDENDGNVFWETSLGKGRPGWHIECSAMSIKNLGENFDIHTGGVDNIFPHHENEIAQSECATGKHFVNYWLHNEHVLVEGKKMAKSAGNFVTLRDLPAREYSPLAYRYLLLTAHYRSQLNFTWESLGAAQTALVKLYKIAADLKTKTGHATSEPGAKEEYAEQFLNLINNDLDTPKALALVWEMFRSPLLTNQDKLELLLKFDEIFGLKINENVNNQTAKAIVFTELPAEIKDLVLRREKARLDKDWAESDRLRDEITSAGYDLKDTPEGPTIHKI